MQSSAPAHIDNARCWYLRRVAQRHPALIDRLPFKAASQALLEFGRNPRWLGGELGITMVFHDLGTESGSAHPCPLHRQGDSPGVRHRDASMRPRHKAVEFGRVGDSSTLIPIDQPEALTAHLETFLERYAR